MTFTERLRKGLARVSQLEVAPGEYTVREESAREGWLQVVDTISVPRQKEIAAYLSWLLAYNMSSGIKYDTNADILELLLKSIGFSSVEDMLENAIDFSDVKYYVDIVDPRNISKANNTPAEAAKDSIKRINNTAASKVLTMEELSSMSTEQLAAKAAQTVEAINASTKSATESIKRSGGGGGGGGSTGFTTGEVVGIVATLGVLGFCAYKAWDKFYGDGNVNDIELADYGFSSSFVPGANFSNTF